MIFYAERPARRAMQVVGDLLALGWLAGAAWLAREARDQVLRLQAPGERLAQTGDRLSGTFRDAAGTAGRVPLVGDELARALGAGTRAGRSLATAGREQVEVVAQLAVGSAVLLLLFSLLPVLLWWLPLRWRYARAAANAAAARNTDLDLLALRALVNLPADRLLQVSPDPMASWRRGEPEVCARLAELQLRELGLRPRR